MADELPFLSRWSRRKVEAKQGASAPAASVPPAPASAPVEARPPEPLPPVESLTPESDFTPFLKPDVDEGLKRQALRALFRDPQFNVMDGLDIYVGDYSQPDPIPPEMLARLNQLSHLGVREREPEAKEEPAADESQAAGEAAPAAASAAPEPAEPAPANPAGEPPSGLLREGENRSR